MVIETRVTKMLGIEAPIVQGGMMHVGTAEMASAASNAGALGMITALNSPTPEALRAEIRRCRTMTKKPFGVNLTILPAISPPPYMEYCKVVIEEGIKVVETAGNNPEIYIKVFKDAGIICIHKCVAVRHALKAEKLGADIVSIDGFECAGHPGDDDVGGLVLLAKAARKLTVPFIASGGIGDGRGLAAALALGADGVNMGSRFMATVEAPIHSKIKEIMARPESDERSTTHIFRTLHNTARVYKNDVAKQVVAIENRPEKANFNDVKDLVSGVRGKRVYTEGDPEIGIWTAGQVIGLIDDVPTCRELVQRMVSDAENIITARLAKMIKPKL